MLALKRHSEVCLTTNTTNTTLTTDASKKHRRSQSTSIVKAGTKKPVKQKNSTKQFWKTPPPQKSTNTSKELPPPQPFNSSDLVETVKVEYERVMRELEIVNKVEIREFFALIYAMKPGLRQADILATEEVILLMWRALGGVKKQYIDEQEVFKTILYTEGVFEINQSISQEEKDQFLKRFEAIQKLKPSYPLVFKKVKPKKVCKIKHIKQSSFTGASQLDVLIKISEAITEKVSIFNETSVDQVAISLGLKHKLPLSKVKLIKKLILSQLKKQLTRITEQSSDTLSDISNVFNELQ